MNPRRQQRNERGSAFLLALIIIVLLTILGVSIVLVTETENVLGHTEKTVDRQFYAAETGLWAQMVGIVVASNWHHERVAVPIELDTGQAAVDKQFAYAIQTTKPLTLASACPAWTDCGEDLPDEDKFLSHFVVVSSTSQRVTIPSTAAYDPDNSTTFVSPFVANDIVTSTGASGAIDKELGADIRFNFKPGVEVIGQSSIEVGLLAGPLRGAAPGPRNEYDGTLAENNSGHRIDSPAAATP